MLKGTFLNHVQVRLLKVGFSESQLFSYLSLFFMISTSVLNPNIRYGCSKGIFLCTGGISYSLYISLLISKLFLQGVGICHEDNFPGGITNGAQWYIVEGGMQVIQHLEHSGIQWREECRKPLGAQ